MSRPPQSLAVDLSDVALVILGHGSTVNPDSSQPSIDHAATIRRRGIFSEVVTGFWKEQPSFRDVLRMVEAPNICVVPNFISEGYFTEKVIPRELELDGRVTQGPTQQIFYSDPVGNHPKMTSALLKRAAEVAPGIPPEGITLLIVGHGTGLNENSARAAKEQVKRIAALGRYAEVKAAYMEEEPLISDWDQFASTEHVVVVPFFIADGLHSYQDIPVLLGIYPDIGPSIRESKVVFEGNPYSMRGKQLYYAPSIGTEPEMAAIIVEMARAALRSSD